MDIQGADTKIWEESLEAIFQCWQVEEIWVEVPSIFAKNGQEVLEPCVAMIDVFEFLGAEDTIASGLSKAWGPFFGEKLHQKFQC